MPTLKFRRLFRRATTERARSAHAIARCFRRDSRSLLTLSVLFSTNAATYSTEIQASCLLLA